MFTDKKLNFNLYIQLKQQKSNTEIEGRKKTFCYITRKNLQKKYFELDLV